MRRMISLVVCMIIVLTLLAGCSNVEETIPTTLCNHNYTSAVTKEPTHDAEGERSYVCVLCGDTYTEPIEKLTKHVVPDSVLDRALTNAKYYASPFSISVGELVYAAMDNYSVKYYLGEEAISLGYLDKNSIDSSVNLDYLYVAIISGDTLKNPDIPYLTEYEAEAIKVWMIFDENDQLLNYGVVLCNNLRTCAILIMSSGY